MQIVLFFIFLFGATGEEFYSEYDPSEWEFLNEGGLVLKDDQLNQWQDKDRVEVYIHEYELQNLGLSGWLQFSTQHIGLVFQNTRNYLWFGVDKFARSDGTIASIIVPAIAPDSEWKFLNWWQRILVYLRGDIVGYLSWDNLGYVRMEESTRSNVNHLTHIGTTTGRDIKNIRDWILNDFTKKTVTFDMWQFYNGSTNERIRTGQMCHDLVEELLDRINITAPSAEEDERETIRIYRDSLSLNVTSSEVLDMSLAKNRRDYQRFLRFFENHVYKATRDMSFTRQTLSKFIALDIPWIMYLDGDKYVRYTLAEYSIINYCRMGMEFIPGQAYVPAKLGDPNQQCFLQPLDYKDVIGSVKFTIFDLMIWAEQRLDDFICSVSDGTWLRLYHIVETGIAMVVILRGARWWTSRVLSK